MAILPLVLSPDPLLKEISKPVEKVDDKLRKFIKDMINTMYAEGGIGLAAVQVGVLKRILVMDLDYKPQDCCSSGSCGDVHVENGNPKCFINPEIIESSSKKNTYKEGCLSFPGASSNIVRPEMVKVKFLDENGEEKVEEMDGLAATCIQHEIDHLNGITFVDHLTRLKREMVLKKVKKFISSNY